MGNIISVVSLDIKAVKKIIVKEYSDSRGSNLKFFSKEDLKTFDIDFSILEILKIHSKRNTLRGIHYQKEYGQSRIITCTKGSLLLAIVDINNPKNKCKIILDSSNVSIYIPKDYALGTLALEDSEFICLCGDNAFKPEYSDGFRWDDPIINIDWNCDISKLNISDNDRNIPLI